MAKCPAERARPRHQQRPRRILVEPVHQLGPPAFVRQTIQQSVEMVSRLGPALRREPRRLVEHEGVRVLMDDHVANELLFVRGKGVALRFFPRRARRGGLERRNADFLPRLDAIPGYRPLARQPQLTRPRPARYNVEADLGHVPLEPTVEPDAVVVLVDGEGADVAHERALSES